MRRNNETNIKHVLLKPTKIIENKGSWTCKQSKQKTTKINLKLNTKERKLKTKTIPTMKTPAITRKRKTIVETKIIKMANRKRKEVKCGVIV